jgi:hypothetical protein
MLYGATRVYERIEDAHYGSLSMVGFPITVHLR